MLPQLLHHHLHQPHPEVSLAQQEVAMQVPLDHPELELHQDKGKVKLLLVEATVHLLEAMLEETEEAMLVRRTVVALADHPDVLVDQDQRLALLLPTLTMELPDLVVDHQLLSLTITLLLEVKDKEVEHLQLRQVPTTECQHLEQAATTEHHHADQEVEQAAITELQHQEQATIMGLQHLEQATITVLLQVHLTLEVLPEQGMELPPMKPELGMALQTLSVRIFQPMESKLQRSPRRDYHHVPIIFSFVFIYFPLVLLVFVKLLSFCCSILFATILLLPLMSK